MALTSSVCLLRDRAITFACCLQWLIQAFITLELDCCCEISPLGGHWKGTSEYRMQNILCGWPVVSAVVHIVKEKIVLIYTSCYGLVLMNCRVKIS